MYMDPFSFLARAFVIMKNDSTFLLFTHKRILFLERTIKEVSVNREEDDAQCILLFRIMNLATQHIVLYSLENCLSFSFVSSPAAAGINYVTVEGLVVSGFVAVPCYL